MFTVVKQKVNSSEIRTRLDMEPDLIQAMIMNGNVVVHVVETFIEDEEMLDKIIDKTLAELS